MEKVVVCNLPHEYMPFHGLLYQVGIPMLLILLWSVFRKKLTPLAALTAMLLGLGILEASATGAFMLIAFFIMGVLASAYKKSVKRTIVAGQPHSETRNHIQVLCNGGIAGICAILVCRYPSHAGLYVLLMAGSLAAAAADTVASELGTVMGKRFVNVLNFRKEERGLDGVISLEGTLAGIAAAAVMAIIYGIGEKFNADVLYIILAGAIGNHIDSILGATLQRKGLLNNDAVNALNTFTGAMAALALKLIFG